MKFTEYLKIGAVNWSTLKEMRRSPLHYFHRTTEAREDTTRLALGRAVHTAVLDPDRFPLDYVVFEGERRQGNAWKEFEAQHSSKTILKIAEYEECLAIRDAVRRHPVASRILAKGRGEQAFTWTDGETGLPCKGLVDWLSSDPVMLIDLKTTSDVDVERFANIVARLGYHAQIAWYLRGLAANGVLLEHEPRIIAVEDSAPYDVAVFTVDADTLYAGNEECSELLARVKQCRESGRWDGRYATEEPLQLPRWWYAQDDDEDGLGVTIHNAAGG